VAPASTIAPVQAGEHVWFGRDLAKQPDTWTWNLSPAEIDELITAAAPFAEGHGDLPLIDPDEFPLPTLGASLAALGETLITGRGFQLVRGLPVRELGHRHAAAAFLGLGAHLGSARSQNSAGHLLGHVRDVGLEAQDPEVRIYQTSQRQTFHTDSADVVGLLCLETAQSGGTSMLASAATIFNEMMNRAPDLAALLFEPVATDRRGEVPEGQKPFFEIPVLNWYDDALTVIYQRQYIDSAQRFAEAPRLTPRMIAALDMFDQLANDPNLHLALALEVGDMQFVHNHSLLHDRTGFVDKPGAPRHLLRLWLSVDGDRELPPSFAQRYGSVTVGDRGGIITPGAALHAPLP
jgi:hypothetical protein